MHIDFFTIAVLTLLLALGSFSFAHSFYNRGMLFVSALLTVMGAVLYTSVVSTAGKTMIDYIVGAGL